MKLKCVPHWLLQSKTKAAWFYLLLDIIILLVLLIPTIAGNKFPCIAIVLEYDVYVCMLFDECIATIALNSSFMVELWTMYQNTPAPGGSGGGGYHRGLYTIYYDITTFFATFSHTSDPAYPPCVDVDPVPFIKRCVGLCFVIIIIQLYRCKASVF